MRVGFISLGCSKNRVDTEIMMALIKDSGYKVVDSLEKADAAIVNTCGFIDDAKEESINTIIEIGKLKEKGLLKYIVASGCLTQRYGNQLADIMPELDGVLGISPFASIVDVLDKVQRGEKVVLIKEPPAIFIEKGPRILTTPPGSAYLKITEGCSNRCAYCAIPSIKGVLRSRPVNELVAEAGELAERGVKELVIIGQDTAAYGKDLYGEYCLPELLEKISQIEGLMWIRLMYLHPAHINQRMIDAIAGNSKVIPYLDIPIQHASSKILRAMKRGHSFGYLKGLIGNLRNNIKDLVLRTTVMVGFPGEEDGDFKQLYDFVAETEFDWLGVFAFNPEEGTPAASMGDPVQEDTKTERREKILALQKRITRKKNITRINKKQKILISSRLSKNLYIGRGYYQAPEVDGVTLVKTGTQLAAGKIADVFLKGVRGYDVIGELDDEHT